MSGTLAMAKSVDLASNSRPVIQVLSAPKTVTEDPSLGLSPVVLNDRTVDQSVEVPQSQCPQWFDLAMQYFSFDEWDTIDFLLHRESRCDIRAFNPKDSNGKPSYSLFQINGFWCNPSKHYAKGFLQEHDVLSTCDDLFDPITQFKAARAIYVEGLTRYGVGWRSWGSYPETR